MFFLWGLVVASPFVAAGIVLVSWLMHTLVTPWRADRRGSTPWNRPTFWLTLVTTVVATAVATVWMTHAQRLFADGNDSTATWMLAAINLSAALLTATGLLQLTESLARRAVSSASVVLTTGVLVVAGLAVTGLIAG